MEDNPESVQAEASDKSDVRLAASWLANTLTSLVNWIQRDAAFWTALATVLMAITTGIYTFYARKQWREMQGAGRQTDQLLCLYGNQLLAAQQQGRDTHELALTTRDALIDVQRAIMTPEALTVSRGRSETTGVVEKISFVLQWKNTGNTPTKYLQTHFSWMPSTSPTLPKDFKYPDLWATGIAHIPTQSFAGPQQVIQTVPVEIDRNTIMAVRGSALYLYFWGWARYRDVFEGTVSHVSEYCFQVSGFYNDPFGTNPADVVTPIISNCYSHNCQDEECTGKPRRSPAIVSQQATEAPKPCPTPKAP
jgi:hypothetical protein